MIDISAFEPSQLAQKIGGHLNDLRGTQQPLQLSTILQYLQEVTASFNPQGDVEPWDIIGMFVTRLGTDLNNLLPAVQAAIKDEKLINSVLARLFYHCFPGSF